MTRLSAPPRRRRPLPGALGVMRAAVLSPRTYLMLLGSIDVIPHQDLRNPVYADDKEDDPRAWGDLPYACEAPYSKDVADFVGDSLGLALEAQHTDAEMIVFCGVHFMAESAKILNPDKTVLLPNLAAGCALADSITPESLEEWMERYPGYAVVTYVNSTAEIKAMSDICCTSANAVAVVESLGVDRVIFLPDEYLGKYVASQTTPTITATCKACCGTTAAGRKNASARGSTTKVFFFGAARRGRNSCPARATWSGPRRRTSFLR